MGFYHLIHSGSLFRRTRQHIEVCHVTLKLVKQLLDGRDRRRRLSVLQALLDITARFLFQTRIKSRTITPFFHFSTDTMSSTCCRNKTAYLIRLKFWHRSSTKYLAIVALSVGEARPLSDRPSTHTHTAICVGKSLCAYGTAHWFHAHSYRLINRHKIKCCIWLFGYLWTHILSI